MHPNDRKILDKKKEELRNELLEYVNYCNNIFIFKINENPVYLKFKLINIDDTLAFSFDTATYYLRLNETYKGGLYFQNLLDFKDWFKRNYESL